MSAETFPMRILAASDGSGPSDAAIRLAGSLAAKTGSELHVLHVSLVSKWIYPDLLSEAQVDRIKADSRKRLEDEESRARESGVEIAQSYLRFGRADAEILSLAEELGVGMIVIGNRSGDAMSRILLGNDAESVVRHAHCAVLVAREPAV
jgi:nucleotide-binding universal stress UspA family protein